MVSELSLSKEDLAQPAGSDLLALLVKVSEDGTISKNEFIELQSFIKRNLDSKIPAIMHLNKIMHDIASDGIVTKEEIKLLFSAIVAIMPTKERRIAKVARKELEVHQKEIEKVNRIKESIRKQEEKEKIKKEKEEQKIKEQAELLEYQSAYIGHFDFIAAGCQHYTGYREVDEDSRVILQREPTNQYDKNAVLIKTESGNTLGYVPRFLAEDIAPHLDANCDQHCYVKKMLATNQPVVVVSLFRQSLGIKYGAWPTISSSGTNKSLISRILGL